jgi:predicted amidohydrolase
VTNHEPAATVSTATRATIRLGVAQLAAMPRALQDNAERIAAAALEAAADLLVTPELSLTGYDLGDSVHRLAVPAQPGTALTAPDGTDFGALAATPGEAVIGLVEAGVGGPYNSAVVLRAGHATHRHRKLYLPTYGMFDEARWFGRGRTLDTWEPAPGWRAGILICEDFWHPGLTYVLAARGIDLLVVPAAAPGRGVWAGGGAGAFASADVWERMARTTAQLYGIYVALANRVGEEGGVSFAGGSLVVAPTGEVLARAGDAGEVTLAVELSRAELARARRPYAHARDDDPALVLRELARGLEAQ